MTTEFSPFLNDVSTSVLDGGILWNASFDERFVDVVSLPFELPMFVCQAVQKRRASYCAGRLLCHLAQKDLGRSPQLVGIGRARAPIWPLGLAGSISHSNGHAVVWIAEKIQASFGVDIEMIADDASLDAIMHSALSQDEAELLGDDSFAATAAFSAKETLFKALFPKVGRFFGFQSAKVRKVSEAQIILELVEDLTDDILMGQLFEIGVRAHSAGVMTWLRHPDS